MGAARVKAAVREGLRVRRAKVCFYAAVKSRECDVFDDADISFLLSDALPPAYWIELSQEGR